MELNAAQKARYGKAAESMKTLASIWGAVGALSALSTVGTGPVGAFAAGIGAVGVIVSLMAADKFSGLAVDPPRDDWHIVSRFEPVNVSLPPNADEFSRELGSYIIDVIQVRLASNDLLLSLERYVGLQEMIADLGEPQRQRAKRLLDSQHAAAVYNMKKCNEYLDGLSKNSQNLNSSWHSFISRHSQLSSPSVDIDPDFAWERILSEVDAIRVFMKLEELGIVDFSPVEQQIRTSRRIVRPSVLVSGEAVQAMRDAVAHEVA
jgi:hypothetical protein